MSDQQTNSSQRIWVALLPTLLYAAILPYIIYRLTSPYMSDIEALLLAAIPPAIGTVIGIIREHRINLLTSFALVGIAVKLISALLLKDVRLVLVSESLLTGFYGLVMLGSVLIGKPVLLVLARNMFAGLPAEQREQSEQRLQVAGTQTYFTIITAVWGRHCFSNWW